MANTAEPPVATPRRLFIGLLPDAAVQAALVDHQHRWYWRGGTRLTRAAKLHLTLCFLGDVAPADEALLCSLLQGETVAPFDLVLRTPEAWRNHIAVLQPDPHPALLDLHDRLALRLARAGLVAPPGDSWRPHVTLARDGRGAVPPEATAPIAWTVTAFVLIWSRLTAPSGYEVLARYGTA